jgi:hypothetical protein
MNTHARTSQSQSWCQFTIRTRDQFFFLLETFLRQLRVCHFVASSQARGRVCNLLLMLGLASAVPLGSESRRTQYHTLFSQFLRLPQPEGPGPRIYIPQEQGGPVMPQGTGFHLRCLLRLGGLRWRYSGPPLHGLWNNRRIVRLVVFYEGVSCHGNCMHICAHRLASLPQVLYAVWCLSKLYVHTNTCNVFFFFSIKQQHK